MHAVYNINAPKKATNLSINSDLLKQARELKINLSAIFEKVLAEIVKTKQEKNWIASNPRRPISRMNIVTETGYPLKPRHL